MENKPIRPAATVLIFDEEPLRVFMVKRHGRSGFMAGAHVFPGGRVDPDDGQLPVTEASHAHCATHFGDTLDPDEKLAFAAAAARETAEESGLLLAVDKTGTPVGQDVAEAVFEALRAGASLNGELTNAGLALDLSTLHPFAWWLTPEAEPKRYDTRFYACKKPPHQSGSYDDHEVIQCDWLTPEAALGAYATNAIVLAPPTLVCLEDMVRTGATVRFETVHRAAAASRQVCPVLTQTADGALCLALPGDALHPEDEPVWPGVRTRILRDGDGRFYSAQDSR